MKSSQDSVGISYMQSMSTQLVLGGYMKYILGKDKVRRSFGAVYTSDDNMLGAQWDAGVSPIIYSSHTLCKLFHAQLKFMFMRKVNPNRVNLFAELSFDEDSKSLVRRKI